MDGATYLRWPRRRTPFYTWLRSKGTTSWSGSSTSGSGRRASSLAGTRRWTRRCTARRGRGTPRPSRSSSSWVKTAGRASGMQEQGRRHGPAPGRKARAWRGGGGPGLGRSGRAEQRRRVAAVPGRKPVMSGSVQAVRAITSTCRDASSAGPSSQNALHAAVFQSSS